jgi:hypothetical protein
MEKRNKILSITFLIICVIMMTDITFTKNNKYTKINDLFSVIFTDTPLIEKGIIKDEN